MRIKHALGAAALSHEGETFEADEHGYIDAPYELAVLLLNQTEWTAEVPVAVGSTDPYSALFVEPTSAADEAEAAAAAKALEDAEASEAAEAEAAAAEAKAEEDAEAKSDAQAKAKAAVQAKLKAAAAAKAKSK